MFVISLILALLGGLCFGETLVAPQYNNAIRQSMNAAFALDDKMAHKILFDSLPASNPSAQYFNGLLHMTRFGDLGDTASLRKAEDIFNKLADGKSTPTDSLLHKKYGPFRGLAFLQLSYIASLRGQTFRTALAARKGQQILEKFPEITEVKAALLTLAYYKSALLSRFNWLPLVHTESSVPREKLANLNLEQSPLQEFFMGGLLWMYYDAKKMDRAHTLAKQLLKLHPESRIFLEYRADCLFRLGQIEEADVIYQSLEKKYKEQFSKSPCTPCLPIGEAAAIGNQIKVSKALGQRERESKLRQRWNSPSISTAHRWLAPSLLREVGK